MTLIIAAILLGHTDAGFWSYLGVTALWLCHVAYHGGARK